MSFNKSSRKQTGGGLFQEKFISENEEQIIAASGLEAAVEGIQVNTFGYSETPDSRNLLSPLSMFGDSDVAEILNCDNAIDGERNNPAEVSVKKSTPANKKLLLIQESVARGNEFQTTVSKAIGRLLEIQERTLQIREEKLKNYMAVSKIDLEIKTTELATKKCKLSRLMTGTESVMTGTESDMTGTESD